MARSTRKGNDRLEQRRRQYDALKDKDGRKRPGSVNAHKGKRDRAAKR